MSPTVFRKSGYRFFFSSREEERMHVHVISGDGEAKYWLEPEIELKQIETLIEAHYNDLVSSWQTHFGS